MFVGTLNSIGVIQEIKTSNKTKKAIAAGGPLGVTTPSCACEPVQKLKQMWQTQELKHDQSVTPGW